MRREIDRLDDFDDHVGATGSLAGSVLQGLDLRDRTLVLRQVDVAGAIVLGCDIEPAGLEALHVGGAVVHPRLTDTPFRAYRTHLYTPDELFAGYTPGSPDGWSETFDQRVYRWSRRDSSLVDALAKRIHDTAIDDALAELLASYGRSQVVAIMGGHGLARGDGHYRDVAVVSRDLTRRGHLVASGGGPGAMEATNLGGWLAGHDDDALDDALSMLAEAPGFEPTGAWLDTAFAVCERFPQPPRASVSLGIPTWHYGHEPPNVFATAIAKYFDNSIREDGLLAIATGGVVFAPGSAGTVQEVFQDAAQNHYESFGPPSPMVFLGTKFWTETVPVYPLLRRLAADRSYLELLGCYDEPRDIVDHLDR
ncbi:MAG: hypothetical protein OEU32_07635 [Acidimicrobiia bacterium]|nr:hypothetical protein [Acidimicrobiia bacterium]